MPAYPQFWDSTKTSQIISEYSGGTVAAGTTSAALSRWIFNDKGSSLGATTMSGYYLIAEASVDGGQTWVRSGPKILNERWIQVALTGTDNTGGAITAQTTSYTSIGAGFGQLLTAIPRGCGRSFDVRVVWPLGASEANVRWRLVLDTVNPVLTAADILNLGVWSSVAFDAGNFTASGGVTPTWVLASGDQVFFSYVTIGKTMTVSFRFATSTVTGSPTALKVLLPGGVVAARNVDTEATLSDNGGAWEVCWLQANAADTALYIRKPSGAAFANATDTTAVRGEITIEIQ